jgi:transposase
MSKPRGKSQAKKEFDESHSYSSIQLKLNTFVRDPFVPILIPLFNDISHRLSKIVHEAYLLANYHVIKCFNEDRLLSKIDQIFFYSCCSLVSTSTKDAGSDDLIQSADEYFQLRPYGFKAMGTTSITRAMNSHAKQMITMTKNHVKLNIVKRLHDYIKLKYPGNDGKRDAEFFLQYAVYEKNVAMLSNDVKDFKQWFGDLNPFLDWHVDRYLPLYLKKLYQVMQYYDTLDPNTPGVKRFTLLPMKGDFIDSFFSIDPSTLPEILNLLDKEVQLGIINLMKVKFNEGSDEWMFLDVRSRARAIFNSEFQSIDKIADCLWRTLFKIEKYETKRRRFSRFISTNGYAVTVRYQVPKIDHTIEYDIITGINEGDYDTFIGIDPGRKSVCMAYAGETLPSGMSKCVEVSTREVRFDSKMIQQQRWMRKQTQRDKEYGRVSTSLPTLKTVNLETYKTNVRQTLASAEYLFEYQRKAKFRAWRFKTLRFGKKALVKAINKILGDAKRDGTVIGFGDWSQQDGFLKGSEKAPVKKIRRMFRELGIKVLKVDEHRTSKSCSGCNKGDCTKMKIHGRECHRVIRCNNNECNMVWNRDVNGCRNIRSVLLGMIRREGCRPQGLERKRLRIDLPL